MTSEEHENINTAEKAKEYCEKRIAVELEKKIKELNELSQTYLDKQKQSLNEKFERYVKNLNDAADLYKDELANKYQTELNFLKAFIDKHGLMNVYLKEWNKEIKG